MALVIIGFGIAGLIVGYLLVGGFDTPEVVETGIQSVRELVSPPPAADDAEQDDTAAETPDAASAPPAATPTPVGADTEPVPEPAAPASADPATAPPPVAAEPEPAAPAAPASAPSGRPPLNRASHFLPGNYATWTDFDLTVTTPIVLRAGGVISAAETAAGPDGTTVAQAGAQAADELVLPSAPYLALIGRICTEATCSAPFLVGSDRVLCPSELPLAGRLQLLTNNYVRVGGRQTTSRYSTAAGGYAFYTEPVTETACADPGSAGPMRQDAAALAAGEVLRKPEFTLSSGLTFWKPFFLPMGGPFVIRASGRIESTGGRPASTPDGVAIPPERRWWNADAEGTTRSRRGRLYLESVPYHALIGRVCGADGCGEPFIVGSERVVCPAAPHTDRVELWINRVISSPSMLDNQTPLTFEMFDVQTQRGAYRFEVAPAPASACGGG